jgi:hypothetical protein
MNFVERAITIAAFDLGKAFLAPVTCARLTRRNFVSNRNRRTGASKLFGSPLWGEPEWNADVAIELQLRRLRSRS